MDSTLVDDISGKNIEESLENSQCKNWIKRLNLSNTINIQQYNRLGYFKEVATIVVDNEVSGPNQKKKRNTVIQFIPSIPEDEWADKNEWLYLLVVNERIVKIGGTRTGLKSRAASYLCGHHIPERGKSGDCSKTNGYIYNTFDFYLGLGCKIQMYGYKLPTIITELKILDNIVNVKPQTYHAYESAFLDDFKKHYNGYPPLSDNCDPDYKN